MTSGIDGMISTNPYLRVLIRTRLRCYALMAFSLLGLFFVLNHRNSTGSFISNTFDSNPLISTSDRISKGEAAFYRHELAKLLGTDNLPQFSDPKLPWVYAITPTYARDVQKAELTRLCNVLLMVPNLHWIIVEDSPEKTGLVTRFLRNCGVPYTHLNMPTPADWKIKPGEGNWRKPRGVLQRNAALQWLRDNEDHLHLPGVIYFADDDNTYSGELFEEMRKVKNVGIWPVGLVGGMMVEKADIDPQTGKVTGFNAMWRPERPFPIDMAGFGISLGAFLATPEAKFALEVERGYQESELLKYFVPSREDLEVLADGCTKVYVWHTRTEKVKMDSEKKRKEMKLPPTNLNIEV